MLSTFVAILNFGFHRTRCAIEQQKNDFEVINYMWRSLKLTLGFSGSADQKAKAGRSCSEFEWPGKIINRKWFAWPLFSTSFSSDDYDEDRHFDELVAKADQMVDLAQTLEIE